MIRPSKLAIEGFRSFGEDQVFTFPTDPHGFYLVTGENRLEPDLGANGSGKSSLWEALVWVLTGKTTRGLKGKEIANRTGEFMPSVCLEFYIGDQLYGLTRTWNPITLVLDKIGDKPKVIDQDELDALIGGSFFEITRSVLFGQFQSHFLDESGTEKIRILSDILNVSVWDTAVDKSKSIVKKLSEEQEKQVSIIARLDGELEHMELTRVRIADQAMTFESEKGESKKYLEADLRKSEEELKNCKALKDRSEEDLDKLLSKSSKKQNRLDVASASKLKALEIREEVAKAIAIVNDRINQSKAIHLKLSSIEGPCPYCLQDLSKKHRNEVENSFLEKEAELEADYSELHVQYEGADVKYFELEKTEKELQKELKVYLDYKKDLENTINKCSIKEAVLKESITRVRSNLKTIDESKNKYLEELTELVAAIKTKKDLVKQNEATLEKIRDNKACAEFWSSKFKEVRLWIIEQAISELELHVNNALEELGFFGYKIRMDIEKPKSDKSGFIKGFHVFITPKEGKEPIPWESWSGGEAQRLKLAGTLGLADLITSRSGFNCKVEVWDEPTEHLSREGIEDLLQFLGNRSRIRGKQIWLVDHRSLDAGDFDGSVHIIKDSYGSHIQQPQPKTEIIKAKPKYERPRL